MPSLQIECLRCGKVRELQRPAHHCLDASECPRCGYVGWASSAELDERARRELRTRPLERRRLQTG
jgi:hypothetical protein